MRRMTKEEVEAVTGRGGFDGYERFGYRGYRPDGRLHSSHIVLSHDAKNHGTLPLIRILAAEEIGSRYGAALGREDVYELIDTLLDMLAEQRDGKFRGE